jgi:hypothetical protein
MLERLRALLFDIMGPDGKPLFRSGRELGIAIAALPKEEGADDGSFADEASATSSVNSALRGAKPVSANLQKAILSAVAHRLKDGDAAHRQETLANIEAAILSVVEERRRRSQYAPPDIPKEYTTRTGEFKVRMVVSAYLSEHARLEIGKSIRNGRWTILAQGNSYDLRLTFCYPNKALGEQIWRLYYRELLECVATVFDKGTPEWVEKKKDEFDAEMKKQDGLTLPEVVAAYQLSWLCNTGRIRLFQVKEAYCLSPVVICAPDDIARCIGEVFFVGDDDVPIHYPIPKRYLPPWRTFYSVLNQEDNSTSNDETSNEERMIVRRETFSMYKKAIMNGL